MRKKNSADICYQLTPSTKAFSDPCVNFRHNKPRICVFFAFAKFCSCSRLASSLEKLKNSWTAKKIFWKASKKKTASKKTNLKEEKFENFSRCRLFWVNFSDSVFFFFNSFFKLVFWLSRIFLNKKDCLWCFCTCRKKICVGPLSLDFLCLFLFC